MLTRRCAPRQPARSEETSGVPTDLPGDADARLDLPSFFLGDRRNFLGSPSKKPRGPSYLLERPSSFVGVSSSSARCAELFSRPVEFVSRRAELFSRVAEQRARQSRLFPRRAEFTCSVRRVICSAGQASSSESGAFSPVRRAAGSAHRAFPAAVAGLAWIVGGQASRMKSTNARSGEGRWRRPE
jgi:hypothetical protein